MSNKIIHDKLREVYDFMGKQLDALPHEDIDGQVAWNTIMAAFYEDFMNSPRWNDYGKD